MTSLSLRAAALLAALIALVGVVAAVAVAGGDGGGAQPARAAIRTQQGLGLASLAPTSDKSQTGAEVAPAPGAPGTTGIVKGGGGIASPGFSPYYPYAPLQQSETGITVQGYGSASADADSAVLELYFGSNVTGEPVPVPESRGQSGASGGAVAPSAPRSNQPAQSFTEADLQPVVDAIVAQGVARDDVEVTVTSYDPNYASATIRVTVRDLGALQGIVDAATAAAANVANAQLQSTSVAYTVGDCAALERAAMQAAVQDARSRGTVFAEVLGVGLGAVAGASNYSYSPFGGAPCGGNVGGPYPLAAAVAYAQGQSTQVQLVATVSITFDIQ
ncbi:MAG TPA: SIMPL domain-containing protein [Dehalococcoidia bacterium]|nr:SIMPL domain-containing protein [Dehalococcoidia bacterium]